MLRGPGSRRGPLREMRERGVWMRVRFELGGRCGSPLRNGKVADAGRGGQVHSPRDWCLDHRSWSQRAAASAGFASSRHLESSSPSPRHRWPHCLRLGSSGVCRRRDLSGRSPCALCVRADVVLALARKRTAGSFGGSAVSAVGPETERWEAVAVRSAWLVGWSVSMTLRRRVGNRLMTRSMGGDGTAERAVKDEEPSDDVKIRVEEVSE